MKKICFYNNKNIIAERLKALREEKGLSQSNLAARLQTMNVNIDQQMISKIEMNKRQVTDYELACICKCLSVTPNDILNFNERFSSSLNNSNNNLISIKHVDSFKYKGIQIADLISWSVFQSLEHNDDEFIDLIKSKNIR